MLGTTLQLAGRKIHLVLQPGDCRACSNHEAHKQIEQPMRLVSEMMLAVHGDAGILADLRAIVDRLDSVYSSHRVPDLSIVEQVIAFLQTRRLIAIECRLPVEHHIMQRPEPAAIDPRAVLPPRAKSNEPPPTKSWIEIELIDEAGKPVANQKYRIRLTDGELREGTLDAKGRARFADIDPGTCDISFPEIDGREWKDA